MYIYIYIYIYTHTYIYTYIYISSIGTPGKQKLQFPTPSFCAHRRRNTPREFTAAAKSFGSPAEFSSVLVARAFGGGVHTYLLGVIMIMIR